MFWYYFKNAAGNLINNKRFSAINIIGFAFGISVCLAIAMFLIKEYSYDMYNEHSRQIVRLIDAKNNSSDIDYRVKDILLNNFPEVENACLVQRLNFPVEVRCGDKGFYLDDIMSVDNRFFKLFTVPFISGNSTNPLMNINSAVITETTSGKLFGTGNPLGKELLIMGNEPVTITGIIKDFPDNSSLSSGLLVNADNDKFKFSQWIGDSRILSTYRWPFQIYLQLNDQANQNQLINKINEHRDLLSPYVDRAGFLKLKDIYLYDPTPGSETKQGNAGLMNLLMVVGLIILTLAVINYLNLTIAQQNRRNKDTSIKKTLGASRLEIFLHFIAESILVSILALILGIILLWILLPVYRVIFNTNLNIHILLKLPELIFLCGAILLVGLISGAGPAILLSAINPVIVLSSNVVMAGRKRFFYDSLTVFQFIISISLICCVIIVQRQIYFVKNKNPGFDKEQLLRIDLPKIQKEDAQKALTLIDEYRKSPFIISVSASSGVPGDIRMSMGSNMENTTKNISVPCILADTAFIRTFGLKVIKGRDLQPGDYDKVCMLNEAAYRHFEFEDLVNKRFNNFGGYDIIGVLNDFQYTSFHKTIGPVCVMFTPKGTPSAITVRFAANNVLPGIDAIKKSWDKLLPGYPIKYQFYDEWFESMYRSEERFAKTIGLFAMLAIVISCIGILGLATFSADRRIKEIGIRKVNGARALEVLIMLNKDFVKWVITGLIIAIPIAFYSMSKWLSGFAYRTRITWWIFAAGGILALIIALLTVSWQSWRAATRNPVEALRYE